MNSYASLAEIRANIKTEKVTEDDNLLLYARIVSQRIDNLLKSDYPFFVPWKVSEVILIDAYNVNSWRNLLTLPGHWLEVNGVTQNGQNRVLNTDVFAYPPSQTPITQLRLNNRSISWYDWTVVNCDTTPITTTIEGVRGYRRHGATRWLKVDDITNAAGIDDAVTSFTVADVDGADPLGFSPRLSAGQLIRIGTEYLLVTDTDTATNTVTVDRGQNGTDPAAHALGDDVEVWQVEEVIRRVVARQAGLMLARRGAYDTASANDVGTPLLFPQDLLQELYATIQGYAYL